MRGKTAEDEALLALLDPVAGAAGYAIVRLRLAGGDHARRLQIMAERPDGTMLVEDCTALSRAISLVLDAADPIRCEYTLEVSSPGIDRPLTRLEDFATYAGFEARLELDRLVENRRRFKGVLAGAEDGQVAIELEGESQTALVAFAWISEAKLVITDRLMQRGAAARAARLPPPPATGEEAREPAQERGAAARNTGRSKPASPPGPRLQGAAPVGDSDTNKRGICR